MADSAPTLAPSSTGDLPAPVAFGESPLICLLDMCQGESTEFVAAVVDGAFYAGLISREAWHSALADLPLKLQLADVDGRSESIIESHRRFRWRAVGLRGQIQVTLAPGLRVGLVIGERLVVEVDGREHHSDPAAFDRDRIRDARLTSLGSQVLYFSYSQEMHNWPSVEAANLAAVGHGNHRLHAWKATDMHQLEDSPSRARCEVRGASAKCKMLCWWWIR